MPTGKDEGGERRGSTTKKNAFCSFCRKSYRDVGPLVEGPGDVYICGEVDAEGRSILGDRFVIGTAAMNVRRSACLVEITQARIQAGDSDNPEDLIPIYLQQPSNTLEDTVVEDEKEG